MISVIVPANNEEGYIGPCLDLLLASDAPEGGPIQVVVVANGCTDGTVAEASARTAAFAAKGWTLDVLDLVEGGKVNALNASEDAILFPLRVYIDADVHVTPPLIAQLAEALDRPEPTYAGGRPQIRRARNFISERYARFWEKLPFMATGVPGCGVFGVNAAGRARWQAFPQVIADDTFVRNNFAPEEMRGVPATYSWPITEGFVNLVRVRRRQDEGLKEIRERWPDLSARMERTNPDLKEKLALFLRDPLGFVVYASVALAVRTPLFRTQSQWYRGR
ncbi:glycosyltransferase [Yoonia sp. F2084L]|uniref:glycosyltransferase n=1 Tax=Yoonia sp. F2084L TaxID=2926419 RepID=UPI001FF24FC4|nr:glycosyltransferase [Yoonia sp. F2084L]MCK0096802.1 glycosyltransferase [Yoonia sp. F2084L]